MINHFAINYYGVKEKDKQLVYIHSSVISPYHNYYDKFLSNDKKILAIIFTTIIRRKGYKIELIIYN